NWNKDLQYLNLSGNKRLEIRKHGTDMVHNSLAQTSPKRSNILTHQSDLSDFSALKDLKLLGLIDVTCLILPPDETNNRRIRSTGSEIPIIGIPSGFIRYGIADILFCKQMTKISETTKEPSISPLPKSNLTETSIDVWDLVIPRFRNRENEALFAVFDSRGSKNGRLMAKRISEIFPWYFANELQLAEDDAAKSGKPESINVETALRRTFIAVNRKMGIEDLEIKDENSEPSKYKATTNPWETNLYGCSAIVTYFIGSEPDEDTPPMTSNCSLYVANVGDGIAVMSKTGGLAHVLTRNDKLNFSTLNSQTIRDKTCKEKFIDDGSRAWKEIERVQSYGGSVDLDLKINGQVDVVHAFGYYGHGCLGAINSDPWIQRIELNIRDDIITIKNSDLQGDDTVDLSSLGDSGDEFIVIATAAVWRAYGKSYENSAQMMVDIARSAVTTSFNTSAQSPAPQQFMASPFAQKIGIKSGAASIYAQTITQNSTSNSTIKSVGGWSTAAMKIRDVAMSLSGMQNLESAQLVMVLGLKEIVQSSSWWGTRRGSEASAYSHNSNESSKTKERLKRIPGEIDRIGDL
ncbi:cysteinyl-tRNA synthetase, partial [Nowakowskiella sp. JEL0078]